MLLNQGVPVITVSRRLGHAKASITLDIYGHLIPTMQTEVAEMIDELVMPVAVQLDEKVGPVMKWLQPVAAGCRSFPPNLTTQSNTPTVPL